MLRVSSVVRPVLARKASVGFLATFATIALLPCSVALADTVTTNFEPPLFQLGSVNGQGVVNGQPGWKSAPPGAIPSCNPTPTGGQYDQAVVANGAGAPASFGRQSLRMSNLCGNGEFFYQTYSTPVQSPAGETQPNSEYIAQFSFMTTTTAEQPGLFISVSPDSYEGSRMSWVGLADTPAGTQVSVSDTPNVDGEFVDYDGPVLARGVPHTIKFWIKINPGPNNDLVRIFIDGKDFGRCFTTWENYYRTSPEQAPPPNVNHPALLNSLQFRSSVQGPGALATTGGYLFDNVSVTTDDGAGPPGCDVPIDKVADSPTVTAGSVAGYRLTARNRGRLTARNLLLCDHIPNHTTFVSANRKLRRLGRRRCLFIPRLGPGQHASVHLRLRVNATAPLGILDNNADVGPVEPPNLPLLPLPPGTSVPELPGPVTPATAIKAIVVKKVKAIVRVVRAAQAVRPPAPPAVTG